MFTRRWGEFHPADSPFGLSLNVWLFLLASAADEVLALAAAVEQGSDHPLAAGVFYPLTISPEAAALSMSGSTVLVAINAILLKWTPLAGIRRLSVSTSEEKMSEKAHQMRREA